MNQDDLMSIDELKSKKPGDTLGGLLVVKSSEIKQTRFGKDYVHLTLTDDDVHTINTNFFGLKSDDDKNKKATSGDVVDVLLEVKDWNGRNVFNTIEMFIKANKFSFDSEEQDEEAESGELDLGFAPEKVETTEENKQKIEDSENDLLNDILGFGTSEPETAVDDVVEVKPDTDKQESAKQDKQDKDKQDHAAGSSQLDFADTSSSSIAQPEETSGVNDFLGGL